MLDQKQALLCTADGEVFRGTSAGAERVAIGEAVFNTAMSGYQEILTDPSYAGQVVVMTAAHIGNYGVSSDDDQSDRPVVSGFVMRNLSRRPSNWRSEGSLSEFLESRGITAIADVDTRRLTRHIRDRGAMPVAIGVDVDESELKEIAGAAPSMLGQDLALQVTTETSYTVSPGDALRGKVVAIDLGIKKDILRNFLDRGLEVEVVPAITSAEEILASSPQGVFISNGPGDPEPLVTTTLNLRALLGRVPIFGICLGHQVLGLAVGASTYKLPFGHHGGNHPVRRLSDGRVDITSQNHGFAVDLWGLVDEEPPQRSGLVSSELLPQRASTSFGELLPTHQNLNDGTLEGMALPEAGAFSVQYHPEAAPGPREAASLFDRFVEMMEVV